MVYDPEAIRKTYNEIAEREDGFEKDFSLRNEIPREFIRKHLLASDIVLDAGGGSGINTVIMAQCCQRVTLLDISPKMLEIAVKNIQQAGLTEKIDIVGGDVSNLEQFGDEEFSFVVCLGGALSYVREKGRQAIQELVRVAKPGATLILGVDSKYGFIRWLLSGAETGSQLATALEIYETSEYEAGENAFAHLYTESELTTLIREAGCEVIEIASTPVLLSSWTQSSYPKEDRQALKELELKFCTVPELLGAGHHLFCVARKR